MQGLVGVLCGRMKQYRKENFEKFLVLTYDSVCRFSKSEANNAIAGCINLDEWSATLGELALGVP